jgi:hypothetical protein
MGIGPSQGLYLHRTTQAQNKRRQTTMPRVGFKPMIPVFERKKKIYALDRTVTVIDDSTSIHGVNNELSFLGYILCPNIFLNSCFSQTCNL